MVLKTRAELYEDIKKYNASNCIKAPARWSKQKMADTLENKGVSIKRDKPDAKSEKVKRPIKKSRVRRPTKKPTKKMRVRRPTKKPTKKTKVKRPTGGRKMTSKMAMQLGRKYNLDKK